MPSPGEYSPREQRFINGLGIFAIALVLTMSVMLLWKCMRADFTEKVEYRESHIDQKDTEK